MTQLVSITVNQALSGNIRRLRIIICTYVSALSAMQYDHLPRSGLNTGKGDGCCISLSTGYLYSPCGAQGSLFFVRKAAFSFKRALSSNNT